MRASWKIRFPLLVNMFTHPPGAPVLYFMMPCAQVELPLLLFMSNSVVCVSGTGVKTRTVCDYTVS